jgi:hypothetical protein
MYPSREAKLEKEAEYRSYNKVDVNLSSPLAKAPLSNFFTNFLSASQFMAAVECSFLIIENSSLEEPSSIYETYIVIASSL